MVRLATTFAILALAALSAPAFARDTLGVFENWAAFRDPEAPRCYAIAMPRPSRLARDFEPYASVATWPRRDIRGQVHVRLSRKLAEGKPITLIINDRRFRLTGGEGDAWAQDARMDAAIISAMRSGVRMIVSATDLRGRRFSDIYDLSGVATAMDAASVGCVRR
ncbi:hypothetical protein F7D01_01145 [Erythrobacter sp. 3-20A1M]|uniref:invasion associated locus B family protein n=1 Tax=Erythrobacter sp. 3-20A1M TaxID=2653850 RepID=UPI001BFC9F2E|nr:invasion associated locus B family protein [Erythrobacter sp. 3-20A1M]QWC55878.1 hypothetical protein F7D01_01145 [Erythrobacter sp. 3-20A1M]